MRITVKKNYRFLLLILGTLILGVFLRIYKFNQVPISLYWDEVAIFVDAKSIAATGMDMHGNNWLQPIFPSYGDYKLPVYIWLSGFFALFTSGDWLVRLPNLFAGILGFGVIGWLGLELLAKNFKDNQKKLLLFSIFFVSAVSPWSIMFSRTGFEGFMSQFFLTISILLMFLARKNKKLFLLVPIFGLLATYTYFSTRFVWPVLFVFAYLFYYLEFWQGKMRNYILVLLGKHSKRKCLKTFALAVLSLVIFFAGISLMIGSEHYPASQQFRYSTDSVLQNTSEIIQSNVYVEKLGNSRLDRLIAHRHFLTGKKLFENYFDHLNFNYLFVMGEENLRHSTSKHGIFLFTMLPLFFIGLYFLAKNEKISFTFLLIWWLIALLPASVPEATPHALRSLNALTPLTLIISYGLYQSLLYCKNNKLAQKIIILVLLINAGSFSHYYFNVYPANSAEDWQYSDKQTTEQIIAQRQGKEKVIIQKSGEIQYLWFLAYGDYDPSEYQSFEKTNFQIKEFDNIFFGNTGDEPFLFPEREL